MRQAVGIHVRSVSACSTTTSATVSPYRLSWRLLDNSRIRQLADCQLASWTSRGCHRRLCVLSFRSFGGICETATPPVVQSATSPVRELTSWPIREMSNPRVGVSATGRRCILDHKRAPPTPGGAESGTHFQVCAGMFISRQRRPSCVFPDTYTRPRRQCH